MELDEKTQELFDAAKEFLKRSHTWQEPVPLIRLQKAVEALDNQSTAQVLNEVQIAIDERGLSVFVDNYIELRDPEAMYKALGEAIQAWHDAPYN